MNEMTCVAVEQPCTGETAAMRLIDRYRGSLLGLAAGDALGTTLEFSRPGSFQPLTDMTGGGPLGLEPGEWTDDTSMALCLAESLIEWGGFHPRDQLARYVRWMEEGYLSSNGRCFDIGGTVRSALRRFKATGEAWCGSTDECTAGNGSLMRLAPAPLFYATDPEKAIEYSGRSSRTMHGAREAVDACRYYGGLICAAVNGASKEEILEPCYAPLLDYWTRNPLAPRIAEIARGSFKKKQPPTIKAGGYVVECLEAALWALYHDEGSFEKGALLAVNLGDDADTVGAVYGQLAGALYGVNGIPAHWLDRLVLREKIESLASGLFWRAFTGSGSQ
jgi:ADP-ribosylglycohydrolase